MRRAWFATAVLLFSGCPDEVPSSESPVELVELPVPQLLRRLSLDLRGVVPTPEELARVGDDRAALDAEVNNFLEDPRFEARLVHLFNERLLTRVDEFAVPGSDFGLDDEYAFTRAVGDEPLRLLAWIATHDRPWTDAVTADYTMANDTLLQVFQLTPIEGEATDAAGWVRARYTDGRPPGGIVMTSGFWWRHDTTVGNRNRSRAAAISRLLLCEDMLERPVHFGDVDLAADQSTEEAILVVDSCVSCHSALDPIAASLFGFWWFDNRDDGEMSVYHPEREQLGPEYLSVEPAWFGLPIEAPVELGWRIAEDDRFFACAVEGAVEAFLRRESEPDEREFLDGLRDDFTASDRRYTDLVRAIVATEEYRAGGLTTAASEATAARVRTRRALSAPQLATAVEDLTGFRWTWEGYDQLDNALTGYSVLGGGVDGVYVTRPAPVQTLASTAVVVRLAQAAAATVVPQDLALASGRRLLPDGDLLVVGEGIDAAIAALHTRVLGAAPTADRLQAERALWQAVHDAEGAEAAWTSLVSVLLQDPDFLTY